MKSFVPARRFAYGLFFLYSFLSAQQSTDTRTKPALGAQLADLSLTDAANQTKHLSVLVNERPAVVFMLAIPLAKEACRDQAAVVDRVSAELSRLEMAAIAISRGNVQERQRICGSQPQFGFSVDAGQLPSTAALLVDQDRSVRRVFSLDEFRAEAIVDEAELWIDGMAMYKTQCARCHGDDGQDTSYPGTKSLSGIRNRHTEKEIFELTQRAGFVDLSSLDERGRRALAVFVAGL